MLPKLVGLFGKKKKEVDPIEVAIQNEILVTLDGKVYLPTDLREEIVPRVASDHNLNSSQKGKYFGQFRSILEGLVQEKKVLEERTYNVKDNGVKSLKSITYTRYKEK